MAKLNFIFKRKEVKYRIPKETIGEFKRRMEPFFQLDEYGKSTIMSLYYDNDNNNLAVESMKKPKYKEKLRLRSYGTPEDNSTVFVELKKKYDGIVYKRRITMTYEEAMAFLNRKELPPENTQIAREIAYCRDFHNLKPALLMAYDREAYFGKQDPNMRMTIDENIRYRYDELDMRRGSAGHLLDVNGDYLLEVKVAGGLPRPIVKVLNDLEIYPASFSKYSNVYKEIHTNVY